MEAFINTHMAEKELLISLAELDRLEIACPNCKASSTLSVKSSGFPTHCFACNALLGTGISLKWDAWKQFLSQAPEARIVFRVKVEA